MTADLRVNIILDKDYIGPTIMELEPALDRIEADVVDLRWGNTKDEIRILRQHPRKFMLRIADPTVWDRTIATFGKRLRIASPLLERAKLVLSDLAAYDWRKFITQIPGTNPRYLLLQLAANAVRLGKQPQLAHIVASTFVKGVGAQDADVLLRLKSPHMRG
jgi:hypothetical protein